MAKKITTDIDAQKICIQDRDTKFSIYLDEILFVKASGNYCDVYLKEDCTNGSRISYTDASELSFRNILFSKHKIPYLPNVQVGIGEFLKAINAIKAITERPILARIAKSYIIDIESIEGDIIPNKGALLLNGVYINMDKDVLRSLKKACQEKFPGLIPKPSNGPHIVLSHQHDRISPNQFAEFRIMNYDSPVSENEVEYESVEIEFLGFDD